MEMNKKLLAKEKIGTSPNNRGFISHSSKLGVGGWEQRAQFKNFLFFGARR